MCQEPNEAPPVIVAHGKTGVVALHQVNQMKCLEARLRLSRSSRLDCSKMARLSRNERRETRVRCASDVSLSEVVVMGCHRPGI